MTQQSDSPSKVVVTESNYVTNERNQGGITQNNRSVLNNQLISNESLSHMAVGDTWDRQDEQGRQTVSRGPLRDL